MSTIRRLSLLFLALTTLSISTLQAQYFGRNKPRYNDIKFEVEKTPRFDIYNYLKNKDKIYQFATWAEEWASQHADVLKNNLAPNNPILLYNNQADFQQTNAISGNIGVGTGGVTEALKNRVIMPLAFSNEQTHHVLGHEMVHAFQYDLILRGDSTSIQNLQNLPLWMVEGMAEDMSKGSYDTYTAMWMRDAVLNDDVPTFRKLDNPEYFPYRYGQAFWAYMAGKYGDEVIEPLFRNTALYGFEGALTLMFGKSEKEMSEEFVIALKKYYAPYTSGKKQIIPGKEIINDKNAGKLNVSPNVSPDGKYMIFLSEKSVFSTDLYLARTSDGKIIRKLSSSSKGGHIEEFNYIESAGTWSPNSKEFAYIVFAEGHNELLIKNVDKGSSRTIKFKDVPALSNPAWSPDGKSIVLVGMVDGQVDMFQYILAKDELIRLTNDQFSEMQPAWSADGKMLTYATDEKTFTPQRKNRWTFNIATRDMTTGTHEVYDIFTGADNLNPQYDDRGNIYFLSDRDGYRNIYRYSPTSDSLVQLTELTTGVTGITPYSPALSVSYKRDRMVYSYYNDHDYKIKSVRPESLPIKVVNKNDVDQRPGTLPHMEDKSKTLVNSRIDRLSEVYDVKSMAFSEEPYKAKIKLDMITGGTGIGVGTNQGYGTRTGLTGGIAILLSDMLGEHQIFSNLAVNGQIYDFGGQVFYLNNTKRISWGLGLSHIPAVYSGLNDITQTNVIDQNGLVFPALKYDIDLVRRFEEGINGIVQYPFNISQRVELGLGYSRYHYRITSLQEFYYYDPYNPYDRNNGSFLTSNEVKKDAPPGFNLFNANTAYVGDNAQWGVASPMNGWRYRVGAEKYFGYYDFWTTLVDARYYKFLRPINVSARIYNYNRYSGGGSADELYPLFAIDPTLVRGFLSYSEQDFQNLMGISYDLTYGSKLAAANFEIRLPFTGPERLSLIKSKFILTELAWFFDSGVAFNVFDQFKNDNKLNRPPILMSTGVSLRVNLFGALVLEPYYAKALNKGGKWNFGLNLIPGW